MFEHMEIKNKGAPCITVMGIGGAGTNIVRHMVNKGLSGLDFVCANGDPGAFLQGTDGFQALDIGRISTRGRGQDPEWVLEGIEDNREQIEKVLDSAPDLLFLVAGLGGCTGSIATPVIGRMARERGVHITVVVATTPFEMEGNGRRAIARKRLGELAQKHDTVVKVSHESVLRQFGEQETLLNVLNEVNDALLNTVQSIVDLIRRPGSIQTDYGDIGRMMRATGMATAGTGIAAGVSRAREAVDAALSSYSFDRRRISSARGLLVNITHSGDLLLRECDEIAAMLKKCTDGTAEIKMGLPIDDEMDGRVRVTVIAAGLDAGSCV